MILNKRDSIFLFFCSDFLHLKAAVVLVRSTNVYAVLTFKCGSSCFRVPKNSETQNSTIGQFYTYVCELHGLP